MDNNKHWRGLERARKVSATLSSEPPILLDTAMGSENSGDWVIMAACNSVAEELFGSVNLLHIPTHYYDPVWEGAGGATKLLCGTNILYTHMAEQRQWALPLDYRNLGNVCLLGVGMSDIGVDDRMDFYTKRFYRSVLSKRLLHSVRDEMTRQRLLQIGVKNVLNTACPTMWSLTPEAQKRIPARKARNVLTSITDYCFSPEYDLAMIRELEKHYEKVTIWVQGSHDIDWCLDKIIDLNNYELVGPDINQLDEVLGRDDLDYIGTRLHAGIRCLNRGHRSLIISVDNRARQIGKDTNLPVLERSGIEDGALSAWINNPLESNIRLPWDSIEKWKKQFI